MIIEKSEMLGQLETSLIKLSFIYFLVIQLTIDMIPATRILSISNIKYLSNEHLTRWIPVWQEIFSTMDGSLFLIASGVDPAEGFQCPLPQGHIAQISTHGL
jgi:hypothetical protein